MPADRHAHSAPDPQNPGASHPVHGMTQKNVVSVGSASLFSMSEQIGAVPGH